MARRVPARRFFVLCVVLAFGVVLGATVFEGLVRLLVPTSDFFWQWDPALGARLIPDKRGRAVKPGLFDVSVSVNSSGFRDAEHAEEKPAAVRRVVLLGDSFVEALQVPFEKSVTTQLGERVNRNGLKVELINLGVSGFGTAREYLALREYGLRYAADLVLLFFVGNDVSDNSKRLQGLPYVPYPVVDNDGALARDHAGWPRFTPFADQSSALAPLTAVLKNHSKAYRLIRETIDRSPGLNGVLYRAGLMSTPPATVTRDDGTNAGHYEIYRTPLREPWAEAWRVTEQLLLATRDLAEANGARFAVVLVPGAWEVDADVWSQVRARVPALRTAELDLEQPSRRLVAFLRAHAVPVVDLLPEFRARHATSAPLYFRGDAHWTVAGHRLASEVLARPVTELIQKSPAPTASRSGVVVTTERAMTRHAPGVGRAWTDRRED